MSEKTKKRKAQVLLGTCPHCHGTLEVPQDYLDRVAQASIAAVERVTARQSDDGPYVVLHVGPSAHSGSQS